MTTEEERLARIAVEFSDPDELRMVRRGHLRWLHGCRRVLDVGCGHGILLELLRAAGIDAYGVDQSSAAVEHCRGLDFTVEQGPALKTLMALDTAGERFDGVVMSHVVEHMQPDAAMSVFCAAARILDQSGCLLVVTPNFKSLIVMAELFWLDPTHVRPYPRPLLERMGREAGFELVASFDDPVTIPRRTRLRQLLAKLRSALSGADRAGPLDSIVVFRRG